MQAQNNNSPSAATEAQAGNFVKVEGGGGEQTSAEGTLILAYLIIWAIMTFFVARVLSAQRAMRETTEQLLSAAKKGIAP